MGKRLCVNPSEKWDYEPPGGGTFTVGVIPKEVMVSVLDLMTKGNIIEAQWMACKYGVKGHAGLSYSDGKDVEFKIATDDRGRTVVSDETLEVYRVSQVCDPVAAECVSKGKGPKA